MDWEIFTRIVLNMWGSLQIAEKDCLVEGLCLANAFVVMSFVMSLWWAPANGLELLVNWFLKWSNCTIMCLCVCVSAYSSVLGYHQIPSSLKIIATPFSATCSSHWCWYVCASFCCQGVECIHKKRIHVSKFCNWMQLIGSYSYLHRDSNFYLNSPEIIVKYSCIM